MQPSIKPNLEFGIYLSPFDTNNSSILKIQGAYNVELKDCG
jgi:hypothetical protein